MRSDEYTRLMSVLRGRRSIRQFSTTPVPDAVLEQLVEAARWAPSASNRQDWSFMVVRSPEKKAEMALAVRNVWSRIAEAHRDSGLIGDIENYAAGFAGFETAPVVIVVTAAAPNLLASKLLGDHARLATGSLTSAAMAAQNLLLAAHTLGLGGCCMTGALAAEKELRQLLALGRKRELVCLITLGYPAEHPVPPPRKALEEIMSYCHL